MVALARPLEAEGFGVVSAASITIRYRWIRPPTDSRVQWWKRGYNLFELYRNET